MIAIMKNTIGKKEVKNLRKKAIGKIEKNSSKTGMQQSEADILKLIHELEVHQIELEMQNEELTKAKEVAETATKRAINLYEFAPTGYFTLARDGRIIELNLSGAKLFEKERSYLINKQIGVFLSTDANQVFCHFLDKVFESKTKQNCEFTLSAGGDNLTHVFLTGITIENIEQCWLTIVDITELRQAEETLKENNSRLKLAMQTANMDWWGLDIKTGSVTFEKRKAEMLGYPPEKFKHYQDFTQLLHPDDYCKAMNAMQEHIHGELNKYEVEYRILTKSGVYKWFFDIGSVVKRDQKGNPLNVMGLIVDITSRKNAEDEIISSKEQLTELYKHLNQVREEERTSIAREIHDDLGQSLAGLKIDLIGIKEDINDKNPTKRKIDKAITLVSSTIKTVQKLSSQLRPQMLDELGLASAIEWQVSEFKKRTGIKCMLELEEIDDLPDFIAISLFRIFQASLTNIMLHAKAKSIIVKLWKKNEMIHLQLKDDGIGISNEQLDSKSSFGIRGMHERANQMNGIFEINTKPNSGTEVDVLVPLNLNLETT